MSSIRRFERLSGTQSGRHSRRRASAWLGIVLAFGLLAMSCSGDDDSVSGADSTRSTGRSADEFSGGDGDMADQYDGDDADYGDDMSDQYDGDDADYGDDMSDADDGDYYYDEPETDSFYEGTTTTATTLRQTQQGEYEPPSDLSGSITFEASGNTITPDREHPRRACVECQGNIFEDYGVNPFVDTYEDRLSTFALDVDTASYVVTRNYLEGGQLPPIEAVRTEEFVNYFDGGYGPKIDEFVVSLEAAPSPFSDPDRVLMRVGIQAPEVLSDLVIPKSVVLVIDRSGSMGESAGPAGAQMERIDLVHRSVELLLSGLGGSTRVGVVSYDDTAETILEPTQVSGNADEIMHEIRRRVFPRGSTNAEAGLVLGYDMALREADAGRPALVLLLSDGVANVGATNTDDILAEIGERGDIGLSTIGVGLGPFNDELMEQLANKADGTYNYVDTPDEARRIFVDNLTSLLASVARDARIQVEFDREMVYSYRLLGFENRDIADEDFRNDSRDAGEVGAGQSSTALYELTLARGWERSRDPLARATLRYRRSASERITETWQSLTADDVERSFRSASPHFRLATVAAEFAEVLRASPFVDDWSMEELSYQANEVADDLRNDETDELARLIDIARRISSR